MGASAAQCADLCFSTSDAGQLLAFHPFEEGAAGGRDIGEVVGDAGMVERGHRVAAAGNREQLAGLGPLRRMLATATVALSNRRYLEGAERAVPDQRRRRGRSIR